MRRFAMLFTLLTISHYAIAQDLSFPPIIEADFFGSNSKEYLLQFEERIKLPCPKYSDEEIKELAKQWLYAYHQYISTFLANLNYVKGDEQGFSRGATLQPIELRREEEGFVSFGVKGRIDGSTDLINRLKPGSKECASEQPPPKGEAGSGHFYFCIPENPFDPHIQDHEWYEFSPNRFKKNHPKLRLAPPVGVALRAISNQDPTYPDYRSMFEDGVLHVVLLFGYDDVDNWGYENAKEVYEILTEPPSTYFSDINNNYYGYSGNGLGFSDPLEGDFEKINAGGNATTFHKENVHVRYRSNSGKIVERNVTIEVKMVVANPSRFSPGEVLNLFFSLVADAELIHYDGHANYGGGLHLGDSWSDVISAEDLGSYLKFFPDNYQILSIGACHGSGYFVDLFYNQLKERKTTQNLDIITGINELDFYDSVKSIFKLLKGISQLKVVDNTKTPNHGDPMNYLDLLRSLNHRNSSKGLIGVFGSQDNPTSW